MRQRQLVEGVCQAHAFQRGVEREQRVGDREVAADLVVDRASIDDELPFVDPAACRESEHDRNFTPAKIQKRREQIEENIHRYLAALDTADRTLGPVEFKAKAERLNEKIGAMREQMRRLEHFEQRLKEQPDAQLSLIDPDARAMSTNGRRSGIVGYNVQVAVDAKHHLIVAHEVTNDGGDRAQLAPMAKAAREAIGKRKLVAA